jgi:GxxExxY protein
MINKKGEVVKNVLGENLYERELSEQIIGAAIEVHKHLGPGLLESAYQVCLERELDLRKIQFEKEIPLAVEYKGMKLGCGYRLDLLIERKIVVELKSVESIEDIHKAQLLTYLRLSGCKIGLLINFNVPLLKNGIERMVL